MINSKWINFTLIKDTGKTKQYQIHSKESGILLGTIKWYAPWRKYSFFPEPLTIFETTCLFDILSFINILREERKLLKNKEQTS